MPAASNANSSPDPYAARRSESALRSPAAHLLLWILAGLCLWADLASKNWAFTSLGTEEVALIPGFLEARQSLNSGALFGTFSGWVVAFIVASLFALAFVLYFFASSHRKQRFMHVGLAFILAGALGNLYDRTFVQADIITLRADATSGPLQHIGTVVSDPGDDPLVLASYSDKSRTKTFARSSIAEHDTHGVVRDFLKFKEIAGIDYWPWVYNVADALLVAGVAILLLTSWREHKAIKAAAEKHG